MISRADASWLAQWWWTVDKWLLLSVVLLLVIGVVLSFAASPAVAWHIGRLDSYSFVKQHIIFAIGSFSLIVIISCFNNKSLQISYLALTIVSLILLSSVPFLGYETKGSMRWLKIFGLTLQPSELLKPCFIVTCSWLFAKYQDHNIKAAHFLSFLLYLFCIVLLLKEPDVGQSVLLTSFWIAMLFLTNVSITLLVMMITGFLGFSYFLYLYSYHVHVRIEKFLTGVGDTFQIDMGREAILHGGWFGVGPGEGTIKRIIPDSHTDFVFSVAAEEYGIIFCLFIVAIFAFLVLRVILKSRNQPDYFSKIVLIVLAMQIGLQSFVNIGVNLHLLPAKGMTLPFISYGGSSMLSVALCMGAILAITRKKQTLY